MGFLFLISLVAVIIAAAASSGSGNSNGAGSYHGGYARDYDSYYAQVADAADMGNQDAIDEMYGKFEEGVC